MTGADQPVSPDPGPAIDDERQSTFAVMADHLIPAAHGMPSAGEIVDDARLRFVLSTRPDLEEPLRAALRPGMGDDPGARLAMLESDEPDSFAALQFVIVAGYYTDTVVRDRLGYPGQLAKPVKAWKYPEYLEEGLTDEVLARGPVWRDPSTGRRARRADKELP